MQTASVNKALKQQLFNAEVRLICRFLHKRLASFYITLIEQYRLDQPRFALRIVCIELSNVALLNATVSPSLFVTSQQM